MKSWIIKLSGAVIGILRVKYINNMVADALAPCFTRSSTAPWYWQCRLNVFLSFMSKDLHWVSKISGKFFIHPWLQTEALPFTWGLVCQEQVSRAWTSNYIPQILWDVITCPCLDTCFRHTSAYDCSSEEYHVRSVVPPVGTKGRDK